MKDKILSDSLKPSWSRLAQISSKIPHRSVFRSLQYEQLFKLKFDGELLDIGGGEKVDYRNTLKCKSYSSTNIDPNRLPTWRVEPNSNLEHLHGKFDHVLSMNTFEHVLDAESLLSAASKTLRKGGLFVASTPFLYPIHGSPDDFFRPTASWWLEILSRNNFQEIEITPLIWGPFTTGAICSGLVGPLKKLRMITFMILDLLYTHIKYGKNQNMKYQNGFYNFTLGYFVIAKKR